MKGTQEVMYGGTTVSFAAWLAQQDWLLIIGTLASVIGLVLTWHFKLKEERRQQSLYEQQLKLQKAQLEDFNIRKQQFEQYRREQIQRDYGGTIENEESDGTQK